MKSYDIVDIADIKVTETADIVYYLRNLDGVIRFSVFIFFIMNIIFSMILLKKKVKCKKLLIINIVARIMSRLYKASVSFYGYMLFSSKEEEMRYMIKSKILVIIFYIIPHIIQIIIFILLIIKLKKEGGKSKCQELETNQ